MFGCVLCLQTNVLLQSHFSRIPLSTTVARDLSQILPVATRLLQAMVDVLSSNGWLSPALACMELSQMVTQGLWNNESVLMQLPHFTKELVSRCKDAGVTTIPDLMELEDEDRDRLLQFSPSQLMSVAQVCNSYPDIDVSYSIPSQAEGLHAGDKCVMEVRLLRDPDADDDEASEMSAGVPLVSSGRYPGQKTEGWWLVLGNVDTNELLSIKRVAMPARELKVSLDFTPPAQGDVKYMVRQTIKNIHHNTTCAINQAPPRACACARLAWHCFHADPDRPLFRYCCLFVFCVSRSRRPCVRRHCFSCTSCRTRGWAATRSTTSRCTSSRDDPTATKMRVSHLALRRHAVRLAQCAACHPHSDSTRMQSGPFSGQIGRPVCFCVQLISFLCRCLCCLLSCYQATTSEGTAACSHLDAMREAKRSEATRRSHPPRRSDPFLTALCAHPHGQQPSPARIPMTLFFHLCTLYLCAHHAATSALQLVRCL